MIIRLERESPSVSVHRAAPWPGHLARVGCCGKPPHLERRAPVRRRDAPWAKVEKLARFGAAVIESPAIGTPEQSLGLAVALGRMWPGADVAKVKRRPV